jgi:DNA-binding transcriptional LysR family regulator
MHVRLGKLRSHLRGEHAKLHGMPDWDEMRFFLELARTRTLASAARKLRVDYTTVGRRIAAFERELGSKLFERTPDGFVLTDAGEGIRAAAEQMEQCALQIEQRALGADRRLTGLVRVAATESIGHAVVLPAMRKLHRKYPDIRLHLVTGPARLDIARREADFALRYSRPESGELRARKLARVGFALYASADYLARRPAPPVGAPFDGHDAVLFDESVQGAGALPTLTESLRAARAVLRANNMFSLVEGVAQALGIGVLTCFLADRHPDLRRVFPASPPATDDLWLVIHPDVQRTRRVRGVIAAVEDRCREAAALLRGERRP